MRCGSECPLGFSYETSAVRAVEAKDAAVISVLSRCVFLRVLANIPNSGLMNRAIADFC